MFNKRDRSVSLNRLRGTLQDVVFHAFDVDLYEANTFEIQIVDSNLPHALARWQSLLVQLFALRFTEFNTAKVHGSAIVEMRHRNFFGVISNAGVMNMQIFNTIYCC